MKVNSKKNKLYRLVVVVTILAVSGWVLAWGGYQINKTIFGNKNAVQTEGRVAVDEYISSNELGDLTYGSEFGNSVDSYQDRMVVGVKGYSKVGAAYVYKLVNEAWVEEAFIIPENKDAFMNFGQSVSMYGNKIAIGAPRDEFNYEGAGSVFIYELNAGEWLQTHEILPTTSNENDSFGFSVTLFENQLFVGAPSNFGAGGLGSVFQFNLSTATGEWDEVENIKPNVEKVDSYFGFSIDFNSSHLLVGAPFADGSVAVSGSAYLFEFDGNLWQEKHQFIASDGLAEDWFGSDLSISGDRVLIGAWGHDNLNSNAGAAYVFEYLDSSWNETVKLEASDGDSRDQFGQAVDLVGNTVVVAAPRKRIDSQTGGVNGAVYMFDHDGVNWSEINQFYSNNDITNQFAILYGFGTAVLLDSNKMYIGSPFDAPIGSSISSGAVHTYTQDNSIWAEDSLLVADSVLTSGFRGVAYDQSQLYLINSINDSFFVEIYERNELGWINVDQIAISANCAFDTPVSPHNPSIFENYMFIRGSERNVCVFEKLNGNWNQVDSLQPSDLETIQSFGTAMSASNDRIAISAKGTTGGKVYMFENVNGNWVQVDELLPQGQNGVSPAFFGRFSVELLNDMLLVGSHTDGELEEVSGAVYVFEFDGIEWIESDKLTASDADTGDWFGSAISLVENTAVIGAPRDNIEGVNDVGSVYIFTYTNGNWLESTKLIANDGSATDEFGLVIDLSGDLLLVAAPYDNTPFNRSGSAYLFESNNNQWTQIGKMLPMIPFSRNQFGLAAVLGEGRVFIEDYSSIAVFSVQPDLIFLHGYEF